MRRVLVVLLAAMVLSTPLGTRPVAAAGPPVPGPCLGGILPSGALSLVCIPSSGWNGDLVLWAHAYTAVNVPLGFQNLTLPDGSSLPTVAQSLGFAFATTSYRQNGLAILEGANDIQQLTVLFDLTFGRPRHTYLVGASEGGLITTLLVEQSPQLFDGGLALCAPIGDFGWQTEYLGDFRVLFDTFFPSVLPGSPVSIPSQLIANWDQQYVPAVRQAIAANPEAARQLIATSGAAIDPGNVAGSTASTAIDVLWYNVFGTNDATAKLGGSPYGNVDRWYVGSDNDLLLNLIVPRFTAAPTALANLRRYATSGAVTIPLVTMHTVGDDVIPFWQELLYAAKVHTSGRGQVTQIPVFSYGHCNFSLADVLAGFGLLVWQVAGQNVATATPRLTVEQAHQRFDQARRTLEQHPQRLPPDQRRR